MIFYSHIFKKKDSDVCTHLPARRHFKCMNDNLVEAEVVRYFESKNLLSKLNLNLKCFESLELLLQQLIKFSIK